ncbi:MAG: MarR family transcriptional regulator [Eubacteriales bacterium]|nr:MarR family transcriptional regulator [Eubacteriales bacterium]
MRRIKESGADHHRTGTPEGPAFIEHDLSVKFRRADSAFKRSIERQVRDTGVYRSQHRLLMHLNRLPNCSQVEIAQHLEISPAAVAVSIKKLEKGGYIRRETDESDNRVHQVTITPKGEQVIRKSEVMFREVERRMFQGFSEEEMELMDRFLERIYKNLNET